MSGGVDSAVSAYLLKKQGFEVVGVYMKNWSDDFGVTGDCPWEKDMKDVEAVCKLLDIEYRSYNFEKEYRDRVISNFFEQYKLGLTPNPDILCNSEIKFDAFLNKCLEDGADFIATGHYAKVHQDELGFHLLKGIDTTKDQSYFLSGLNQFQLSKTLFPIGDLTKVEVREIARKASLSVAEKKDSQGICFVGDINVAKFLRENIAYKQGDIVDIISNTVLGKHDGVAFYTIGQRGGLKIGGKIPNQLPYFVCSKDIKSNILYVCQGTNNPLLFKKEIVVDNLHQINSRIDFINNSAFDGLLKVSIRYRQKPVACKIEKFEENFKIILEEPLRAVSPGQSAVFYLNDLCLGNAIIVS